MEFRDYFLATEEAFLQEKEQFLSRIEQIKERWVESANLDKLVSQRCEELATLKSLLSKNHLQILRTREECLKGEFTNAQLNFHIRQLQSEIIRFLPHTHTGVPSMEYHMSVDTAMPNIKSGQQTVSSDEKLNNELTEQIAQWRKMLKVQNAVFSEEMSLRIQDNQYFEKFLDDYQKQNQATHKNIDTILSSLIKRINSLRSAQDDNELNMKSSLEQLDRKEKHLTNRANALATTATDKAIEERAQAQAEAQAECAAVREKIRRIERKNIQQFQALKEQDTGMHQKQRELTEIVNKLKRREAKLKKKSDGLFNDGKTKIWKLEAQLNALISATTAAQSCPKDEELAILQTVSTAVGNHANAVKLAENLNLQIQNMAQRLGNINSIIG